MEQEWFAVTGPKVLHVIRRMDVPRGAERLIAELVRFDPNHDVLVFDGKGSFFDLGSSRLIEASNIVHTLWLCIQLKKNYAIFHLHLAPSIYLAFVLGKRAIIHEHSTVNRRRERPFFRLIEWCLYRKPRAVIAASEAVKASLVDWIGHPKCLIALNNFVAPHRAKFQNARKRKPNDKVEILMVAAFEPVKRQDLLLRSLALLPEHFELLFAGDGTTLETCKSLAQELGVEKRVKFLGQINDIESVYAQADICALMSDWEGLGLVVLEAAQMGKATVVSAVPGLQTSCADRRLMFAGEEPKALAAHIEKSLSLARTPEMVTLLKSHAAKFGIESYVEKLRKIYGQKEATNEC